MTGADDQRLEELFHAASALPAHERDAFVARTAAAAPELAERLRRLLAHDRQDTPAYLRSQAPAVGGAADPQVIDRYRIVERIGEGAWASSTSRSRTSRCGAASRSR